ncbi:MAG: response regulator transcription factor, partial [Devosiaceae bacterium]|nr:response regulator transcription factor [Devosiaceae bacterium]
MSTVPIKVLLVDDHPLVLEGIRAIIETYTHIDVIGAASSVTQAMDISNKADPDVIMMDINMSGTNGLDAIELFKERNTNIRIIMLSMHDDREYISTSVMYGASGYVLKDVSTDEIVSAIETVAAGGTYFSSGVSDALMNEDKSEEKAGPLTTREQSVLVLVAEGKSSKDVGELLDISTRTV